MLVENTYSICAACLPRRRGTKAVVFECGDASPLSKCGHVRASQNQPTTLVPACKLTPAAKLTQKSDRSQTGSDQKIKSELIQVEWREGRPSASRSCRLCFN